jgi:hypothetical protein
VHRSRRCCGGVAVARRRRPHRCAGCVPHRAHRDAARDGAPAVGGRAVARAPVAPLPPTRHRRRRDVRPRRQARGFLGAVVEPEALEAAARRRRSTGPSCPAPPTAGRCA